MVVNVKGLREKSKGHTVRQIQTVADRQVFEVTSGASGKKYAVELLEDGGATCSCDWGLYRPGFDRRSGCSHVQAVYASLHAQVGRKVSAWPTMGDAKRQRGLVIEVGDGLYLSSKKAR